MRGVGEGAVIAIVEGREGAPYSSLFDFSTRVNLKDCNKRVFEALALGGGFDSLGCTGPSSSRRTTRTAAVELAVKYGAATQESANSAQASLFGGEDGAMDIPEPPIPECEPWASMDLLNKEREIVGVYISGHPLDKFRLEVDHLCAKDGLARLDNMEREKGKMLTFGGLITGRNTASASLAGRGASSRWKTTMGPTNSDALERITSGSRNSWWKVDGHRDHPCEGAGVRQRRVGSQTSVHRIAV